MPNPKIFRCLLASLLLLAPGAARAALGEDSLVCFSSAPGALPLVENKSAAVLLVDAGDWAGVRRAVGDLQSDFERVTGVKPAVAGAAGSGLKTAVIVGTLGRSALVDGLVRNKKIDTSAVAGRWEAFSLQVVEQPMAGVDRALVIFGSDKRGTIYGVYELSEEMGVSPWYWWADVPAVHQVAVYARSLVRTETGPAVKYRGIFLNDEAPALSGWTAEKFGGMNSTFYAKVFELILRLRGNYLWPAMWNNAFNEDDPDNARLADEYGIVMGTSHHEPMLRSQQEWKRHGTGAWNYHTNGEVLRQFWAEGIRRNRNFESIVTIGMRGDGDEPMSAEANTALLEQIVADQRTILAHETGKKVEAVPQLWALYKEVQEYYERGMRVPDDVTLLWCDDNWGNVRRLPTPAERQRSGGAGVYYHFDYVGGPRNYKWLNTCPISKTWEQMTLARQYGADRIWIVNVGDLKPLEFPIEFFLRLAWAPERWPAARLGEFGRLWASREFGPEHANEVAELIDTYTKYNGRRKPELLSPSTFSLVNYGEAERIVSDWKTLVARAEKLQPALPVASRDAYFELVLWPIKACAIVNELYFEAGRNRLYAGQRRPSANAAADRVEELFRADASWTWRYNEELAGGKWRHFADQAHLGYTYWQQPERNLQPTLLRVTAEDVPSLGVAVEGSTLSWPVDDVGQRPAVLPPLDVFGASTRTFEIFNRGTKPFSYTAETRAPWLKVTPAQGEVTADRRLTVSVDWEKAPAGEHRAAIVIRTKHSGPSVVVEVPTRKSSLAVPANFSGFIESDGCVAMEAEHWSRAVAGDISWLVIPGFGRTLSGVTALPVDAPSRLPTPASPHLEYDVLFQSAGPAVVRLVTAPTLAFVPGRGLRCAVSIDDGEPQVLDLAADSSLQAWERAVADNAWQVDSAPIAVSSPGVHVVKFWPVDPAVVLERVEIDLGGRRPSYLGVPESRRLP